MSECVPQSEDPLEIPPSLDRRKKVFEPLSPEDQAATPALNCEPGKAPIVPVPEDAPPMRYGYSIHGEPTSIYAYEDAQGRCVGYVLRWDFTSPERKRDKLILPVTFCDLGDGQRGWAAKGFPTPTPLYRLPEVVKRSDATVLVVEGEKAADAAAKLFPDLVVTTPPHGAKSPCKADWTVVNGRPVIAWGDHDDAGAEYAVAVGRLCTDAGAASVAIVDVPLDLPAKWDLADELPDGWTMDRLRKLLDAAKPFQTKETAKPNPDWSYRLRADGVHRRVEREGRQTGEVTIDTSEMRLAGTPARRACSMTASGLGASYSQ